VKLTPNLKVAKRSGTRNCVVCGVRQDDRATQPLTHAAFLQQGVVIGPDSRMCHEHVNEDGVLDEIEVDDDCDSIDTGIYAHERVTHHKHDTYTHTRACYTHSHTSMIHTLTHEHAIHTHTQE